MLLEAALAVALAAGPGLTVDRAERAIHREAQRDLIGYGPLTVRDCVRTGRRRVTCWAASTDAGCVQEFRFVAQLARDGHALSVASAVNGAIRVTGKCPSLLVTPIDGEPTVEAPR